MAKKKEWVNLIIGFIGSMLGLIVLNVFNRNILMLLPLPARMITMVITYWLIALVPIILMTANKEKPSDYGFTAEKLGKQIIVGILIAAAMSLALTVVPHLLGFGEYVSSEKNYTRLWQFIYEFIYCIFAVGFAEEFVFRGYIYKDTQYQRKRNGGGYRFVRFVRTFSYLSRQYRTGDNDSIYRCFFLPVQGKGQRLHHCFAYNRSRDI